jgi:hypothetical protein
MKAQARERRSNLKQEKGWLVAGEGFQQALVKLSDGAFKLFALLSLRAGPTDGCVETTQTELAKSLKRSKRAVGIWTAELEAKAICQVDRGTNQHQPTRFEICDEYWPYHKLSREVTHNSCDSRTTDISGYSEYVRVACVWLAEMKCGKGSFNQADARFAAELEQRGVSLSTLETALLLGQARKLVSVVNGSESTAIGSLRYFDPLIAEVEANQNRFTDQYRRYLRNSIKKFSSRSDGKPSPAAEQWSGQSMSGGAKR